MAAMPKVESHQKKEVSENQRLAREAGEKLRPTLGWVARARLVADDAEIPRGAVKVHFIRHGEGDHNVLQREWRADNWDGVSEPYTIDRDPEYRHMDSKLTPVGVAQAEALVPRAEKLEPGLLVVSPLRRSTQTGLIAFRAHVARGLRTVAHEGCHEMGGRHTCDRRLALTALRAEFPDVRYDGIAAEDDPLWGDGVTRESWDSCAGRGARFVEWLCGTDEYLVPPAKQVVVASHSAYLLTLFNAVLVFGDDAEEAQTWFGVGEMRTVMIWLKWKSKGKKKPAKKKTAGKKKSAKKKLARKKGVAKSKSARKKSGQKKARKAAKKTVARKAAKGKRAKKTTAAKK